MKLSVKDAKISNFTTVGKRLKRLGEVRIAAETNGTEFWSTTPDVGAVL